MDKGSNERLNALTVLLAEDDHDHEVLFRHKFFKAVPNGLLTCVGNGLLAVRHIMEHGIPDIIITDLSMPVMNGYELIAWIRADPSFQGLPIVVHTNSADAEEKSRALRLGATDFLLKNPSTDQLKSLFDRFEPGPRCRPLDSRTHLSSNRHLREEQLQEWTSVLLLMQK
jgi:CheY-like chemotaxis protein